MSTFKKIIFLLSLLYLAKSQYTDEDWNYANHGMDWNETFPLCGTGQQSPGIINDSIVEKLDKPYFFYANLNLKEGETKIGKLESLENNNLLSLSFQDLGNVTYIKKNNSWFSNDEYIFVEAICHNILIKIPGEHYNDNVDADGELQVNCTFQSKEGNPNGVFVSLPIKIADNETETESRFSQILQCLINDKVTIDSLPYNITFDTIDAIDIIDGYAMMDGVYYYEGQTNYPPCDVNSTWFYVNKTVGISKDVIDQLDMCIDKEKCPYGNNRIPFEVNDLNLYPQK